MRSPRTATHRLGGQHPTGKLWLPALGTLSLVKLRLLALGRPNPVQLRARGRPYFRSLLGKAEAPSLPLDGTGGRRRRLPVPAASR